MSGSARGTPKQRLTYCISHIPPVAAGGSTRVGRLARRRRRKRRRERRRKKKKGEKQKRKVVRLAFSPPPSTRLGTARNWMLSQRHSPQYCIVLKCDCDEMAQYPPCIRSSHVRRRARPRPALHSRRRDGVRRRDKRHRGDWGGGRPHPGRAHFCGAAGVHSASRHSWVHGVRRDAQPPPG